MKTKRREFVLSVERFGVSVALYLRNPSFLLKFWEQIQIAPFFTTAEEINLVNSYLDKPDNSCA